MQGYTVAMVRIAPFVIIMTHLNIQHRLATASMTLKALRQPTLASWSRQTSNASHLAGAS